MYYTPPLEVAIILLDERGTVVDYSTSLAEAPLLEALQAYRVQQAIAQFTQSSGTLPQPGTVYPDRTISGKAEFQVAVADVEYIAILRRIGKLIQLVLQVSQESTPDLEIIAPHSHQLHEPLSEDYSLGKIGTWTYEVAQDRLWWSPELYEIFGQRPNDFEPNYKSYFEVVHPDDKDFVEQTYLSHLQSGKPYSICHRIFTPAGLIKYVQLQGNTFFDQNQSPVRTYGLLADVTALKQGVMARQRSDLNLRRVAENINELFLLTDAGPDNILFASNSFETVMGCSREELHKGIHFLDGIILPNEANKFQEFFNNIRRSDYSEIELCLKSGNNDEKWVQIRVKQLRNAKEEVDGFIFIVVDIHARKLSELWARKLFQAQEIVTEISNRFIDLEPKDYNKAINESFSRIGNALEVDRVHLFSIDWNIRQVIKTHEWCARGVESPPLHFQQFPVDGMEEWLLFFKEGKFFEVVDTQQLPQDNIVRRTMEARQVKSAITVPLMDNGALIGFLGFDYVRRKKNTFNREGKILRFLSETLINVSRRFRTRQELTEERKFLADIMNNSTAIIFEKNTEGRYIRVNRAWERTTGLIEQNVVGKSDEELFDAATARQFMNNDYKVLTSGMPYFTEETFEKNHRKKYFISIKFPVFDHNGRTKGVAGVVTEITQIKQAELQLAEREANLQAIINSSVEAIWSVDPLYRLIYANHVFLNHFENAHHIRLEPGMSLVDYIPPDRWTYLKPYYDEVLYQGKEVSFLNEVPLFGAINIMSVHMRPITLSDQVHGVAVFSLNITDRINAEEALRLSENRFRTLFEKSSLGMLLIHPLTGKVIDSNLAANAYFGNHEPISLAGLHIYDFLQAGLPYQEELSELMMQGSLRKEVLLRLVNSAERSAALFATYLELKEGPAIHVIIQDVSEKRRYLHKVQTQNAALKDIAWMQAHEFRAPLSRALGLLHLLEHTDGYHALSGELLEIIQCIDASLTEMDAIVHSISGRINSLAEIADQPV